LRPDISGKPSPRQARQPLDAEAWGMLLLAHGA
jgi:hypothetical protein